MKVVSTMIWKWLAVWNYSIKNSIQQIINVGCKCYFNQLTIFIATVFFLLIIFLSKRFVYFFKSKIHTHTCTLMQAQVCETFCQCQ
jgi:hypothetical protein